jgi:DNA modification methylase
VPGFRDPAFVGNKVRPVHRWVPWIAGFSSTFASDALRRHLNEPGTVLDPFCGVGTTLVEAMGGGHSALGFEINPYAALAARTKANAHRIDPERLQREVQRFARFHAAGTAAHGEPRSRPPPGFRTRAAFFSPRVLRKVLVALDYLDEIESAELRDVFRLALGSMLVTGSNYSYEPSLSRRVTAGRSEIDDFPVGDVIATRLEEMAEDVRWYRKQVPTEAPLARVVHGSFFGHEDPAEAGSVDLILTSPPYLNNYHYNRNTRPHLYWLGFVQEPGDLRALEEANFGKYWQTVRERDRVDLVFELPDSRLAEQIEHLRTLRVEKGIYGGNGWANYAACYFNDCHRFALAMARVLRPGGVALVVLGNSILQGTAIQTDRYLAEICESVGLVVAAIHVPRSTRVGSSIIQSPVRVAKAREADQLYEAVVEIRKA